MPEQVQSYRNGELLIKRMKDKITATGGDLCVSTRAIYFARWPRGWDRRRTAWHRLDFALSFAISSDRTFRVLGVRPRCVCVYLVLHEFYSLIYTANRKLGSSSKSKPRSHPLCSRPRVRKWKGPKRMVMWWPERILPGRPAFFEHISNQNSNQLCHSCHIRLSHKYPTH